MPLYEHVFLARQDASTQQVEELTTQMTGIVEQAGGKVTKTENWGVRSLTYRMNKNRKAHFVLLNIDAPSAAVAEIERQERISEDVIRYLSVRVEELEEGPSAMMRKADRDRDRDDRGGGFRGDREGGFRGLVENLEQRARRAARRALALLPIAHGLDRNADAGGKGSLGQTSPPTDVARIARVLLPCIGSPRTVTGGGADRLRIGRYGTFAAVRQNLDQPSVCF